MKLFPISNPNLLIFCFVNNNKLFEKEERERFIPKGRAKQETCKNPKISITK